MKKICTILASLLVSVVILSSSSVWAHTPATIVNTFTFNQGNITNSQPGTTGAISFQLFVNVFAAASSNCGGTSPCIAFEFYQNGPVTNANISEIYFDDNAGVLSALSSIDNSDTGVSFIPGANPANLPSGGNAVPPFSADASLSAESTGGNANGVGLTEHVTLYYTLQGGQTLNSVLNALLNGTLRIGLHVRGPTTTLSDSFVNNTFTVSEPGTLALVGIAMLALLMLASKFTTTRTF